MNSAIIWRGSTVDEESDALEVEVVVVVVPLDETVMVLVVTEPSAFSVTSVVVLDELLDPPPAEVLELEGGELVAVVLDELDELSALADSSIDGGGGIDPEASGALAWAVWNSLSETVPSPLVSKLA
jgi:hypothetical protein